MLFGSICLRHVLFIFSVIMRRKAIVTPVICIVLHFGFWQLSSDAVSLLLYLLSKLRLSLEVIEIVKVVVFAVNNRLCFAFNSSGLVKRHLFFLFWRVLAVLILAKTSPVVIFYVLLLSVWLRLCFLESVTPLIVVILLFRSSRNSLALREITKVTLIIRDGLFLYIAFTHN